MKKSLSELALESAMIVFSVLLALAASSWADTRREHMLVAEARTSFALEMRANRDRVAKALPYHRALTSAVLAVDSAGGVRSYAEWRRRVPTWSGFAPPDVAATAWQSAIATGALAHMPYSDVAAVSTVYTLQGKFDTFNASYLPLFDFSDPAMAATVRRMHAYMQTVLSYETALMADYDSALVTLDNAATLEHTPTGVRLHVTILGAPADARVAPVREALAHWNSEFLRLGRQVQLDSGTVRNDSIPDDILRAASAEVLSSRGPATTRLRESLAGVPGDIVIALSSTDLISFGVPWRAGSQGVVVLRRADIPPLSMPNTVRNVAAHELGHVLGLAHNVDPTTLMCGRPAPCRPAAFASDTLHFFPLTASDDQWLRERWP